MSDRVATGETKPDSLPNIDIAVAHWGVNSWGGAEYLVTKLSEALGTDLVFTLGEPEPAEPNPYGDVTFEDVTPSLSTPRVRQLQRGAGRVFEYAQWEDVDWRELGDPDVLVTSGATTRAVITPDDTLHINYCHSPPRWYYDLYHDRKDSFAGVLARPLIRYLRTRDAAIDPRVDHYFVNSQIIERRLWKYYKRESAILHPPVELNAYHNAGDDGFYLHLGRLDQEKGVPAIVRAFTESSYQLVFAGGMGDLPADTRNSLTDASNIDYRGFVPEDEKYNLLSRCRAVVFNGRNEDFGIVPIEANASGKPAIVRDDGFPAIFVSNEENGYHHDGSPDGIVQAIEQLENEGINGNPEAQADAFSFEKFQNNCRRQLLSWYEEFRLD